MTGQPPSAHPGDAPGPPEPWVSSGDGDELRLRARQWVSSEALRTVLDVFGGPVEDPPDVAKLREWSARHLDSRAGRERHEARAREYSPAQIRALQIGAEPLGMLSTAVPALARYDVAIVLGGTVTGNEVRARFSVDLNNSGVEFGKLVGAAGYRALTPSERRSLTADVVPAAQRDEYEHLAWVIGRDYAAPQRRTLRSGGNPTAFNSWRIEVLERGGQAVGYLVQAPSRRAGRRADTLDAVLFSRANLGTGRGRTLVMTSSIYAPYTFFLLGPYASQTEPIEVVGTPTAASDQPGRQAQRFAQEIHATLSALPL